MSSRLTIPSIREDVGTALGESIREPRKFRLGNPLRYAQGVKDPIRCRLPEDTDAVSMIWVHGETDNKVPLTPFQVLNAGMGKIRDEDMIYRTPILVRPLSETEYITDGLAGVEAAEFLHEVRTRPQRSIDISQFDYMLIRPTEPPSMRVMFTGGYPVMDGTAYQLQARFTDDLTALGSFTTGKARAVRVGIIPSTATFSFLAGSEFDYDPATDLPSHQQAFGASYPATLPNTALLLAWIRMYEGMTAILQRDILAAQELIGKGGAGARVEDIVTWRGNVVTYNGEVLTWSGGS